MLDFDDVTSDGFYDMGIGGDYSSLKVMVVMIVCFEASRVQKDEQS
jgi:hypothetical protein